MTIMNFKKLFVKLYFANKHKQMKILKSEDIKLLVME